MLWHLERGGNRDELYKVVSDSFGDTYLYKQDIRRFGDLNRDMFEWSGELVPRHIEKGMRELKNKKPGDRVEI